MGQDITKVVATKISFQKLIYLKKKTEFEILNLNFQ